MKATISQAHKLLVELVKADIPTHLTSSPGLGKSSLVKQVADLLNLKVIDYRLSTAEPVDLKGLPSVVNGRSRFVPTEEFPLEGDAIPEGYKGWLLFFDEISNATMATQAAAYSIILDREIGIHKLHPAVRIVTAGNNVDDGAAVTGEMSTALKSRLAHINLTLSVDAWLDWAMKNNIHYSITSFIKFKPTMLYAFDPKVDADTFPCSRTWEMANDFVQQVGVSSDLLQDGVASIISDGPAIEYVNFCKHFTGLPTYADIIKDPMAVEVPTELATLYALSGSIGSQAEATGIEKVMDFLDRLPSEFQLKTFNDFTKRVPMLVTNARVRKWLTDNAPNLLG